MPKILACGDIRGNHKVLQKVIDEFIKGSYDKLILTGDYYHFNRNTEDILRCFQLIVKTKDLLGESFIPLLGDQDIQYFLDNNDRVKCYGYREDVYIQLHNYLKEHRNMFKYAYSFGDYLFTHAGVSKTWYLKHYSILDKWCNKADFNTGDDNFLGKLINAIGETSDEPILWDIGVVRNGFGVGGPLWCDKSELMKDPMPAIKQIVGHTPVKFIQRKILFGEERKKIGYTSVTFIDVLDENERFLKLDIDVN